jgi:hypothetical protein
MVFEWGSGLVIWGAMVRATGGWLVDFWGMWCLIMIEVGCIGYAVVMVVGDRRYDNLAGVVRECCSLAKTTGVDWC